MRILLVNENFPPADLGGTETSVLQSAHGLAEEGHEVHVLARYPGERPAAGPEPFTFHGIPLRFPRTPLGAVAQEYGADPRRLRLRAEAIQRESGPFDIVHANNGISAMALAGLATPARRALTVRSYIYSCPLGHGYCLDPAGRTTCSTALECAGHRHQGPGIDRAKALGAAALYSAGFARLSRAPRSLDLVFADSAFVRRNVEVATGIHVDDVVYEAIDTRSRRVARAPADVPTALFAGRLSTEKGILLLLDAFADARRSIVKARLRILGGGPHHEQVSSKVRELGLRDAVDLLGRVPNEDLPRHYSEAWCVAVPSLWPEPFGIVAAEAALCGTPVLASAVGGLPEALAIEADPDPKPHVLLPPGDRAAWADALVGALRSPARVPTRLMDAVAARVDRRAVARRIARA